MKLKDRRYLRHASQMRGRALESSKFKWRPVYQDRPQIYNLAPGETPPFLFLLEGVPIISSRKSQEESSLNENQDLKPVKLSIKYRVPRTKRNRPFYARVVSFNFNFNQ